MKRIDWSKFNVYRFIATLLFCEVATFTILFSLGCAPGVMQLINTIAAIIGSIPGILTALANSGIITAADASEAGAVATDAGESVTQLGNAVNAYESSNPTGTLAEIQAVITQIQTYLPKLTGWATGKTASVISWITALVGVIGSSITAILADLKPATAALASGDTSGLKAMDDKAKTYAKKARADYEAALDSSGIPAEAVKTGKDFVGKKLARHIGPVRI
jgi:hypothetical protein